MQTRKLDLEKFIRAIPQGLLQEYVAQKTQEVGQEILAGEINADRMLSFLNDDSGIKGEIHQDLIEINDLCGRSMNILMDLAAVQRVPINKKESAEEFSMRIFLKHKTVFDYAHDRFYLQHCSGKVSDHKIDAKNIDLTEQKNSNFREKCKAHFAESLMGHNCKIRFHQKGNILMVAVIHGSYKKSVSSWGDDAMRDTSVITYRPAKEDILEYNVGEKKLRVKASNNDREFYIEAFCKDIICDKSQIERVDRDKTFDLSILQQPGFRFELDQDVQGVYLREVKVKLMDNSRTDVILRSNDVLSSHRDKVTGMWLTAGVIVHAKFLFILKIEGKQKKVGFIITPPNASDLNKKKYASLIISYFERIGLKLNAQTFVAPTVESAGAVV